MLIATLIALLIFIVLLTIDIILRNDKRRAAKRPTTLTYTQGLIDGEWNALNDHRRVLDAYNRLFPNAK